MKKLILIVLMFVHFVNAEDVTCNNVPLDFNEGDTITASFLQEIIERIDNTVIGFQSTSELEGTWQCTSTLGSGEGTDNGYTQDENGLYKVTQDIIAEPIADTAKIKASYPHNLGQGFAETGAQVCRWFISEGGSIQVSSVEGENCYNTGGFSINKRSAQCFTMSSINGASVTCSRKNLPPAAPRDLTVLLSSTVTNLSWVNGDSTHTAFEVRRKSSLSGEYVSVGAPTAESYEDSTIAKGNSYWYRVFATNANGTSVGSNVIQITYSNTPPSMNLSSTISVNEGTTSVVTVGATDADGDSLTYTISNPNASTDAEDLSVSSEGVITFNASPDWEIPTDYNTNNIYDIRVSVSDGTDTVSQDISVVVLYVDGS